ncbi:MrcB family domain-containing protein [Siccirubricoccus deserti]
MRDELQEVITLQRQYSPKNTLPMQRRGDLIRRAIPGQLATVSARLARALGSYGQDLNFEGRDGTGLKTYVPWVRYFSRSESPSAQEGWYCVYLFEAGGKGVYLTLAHGSTTFEDGAFKPKPAEQLAEYVAWGKNTLHEAIATDPALAAPIMLGGSNSQMPMSAVQCWLDGMLTGNSLTMRSSTEMWSSSQGS